MGTPVWLVLDTPGWGFTLHKRPPWGEGGQDRVAAGFTVASSRAVGAVGSSGVGLLNPGRQPLKKFG